MSVQTIPARELVCDRCKRGIAHPDATFIASARQDVDDLLSEIDRLTAELARVSTIATKLLG